MTLAVPMSLQRSVVALIAFALALAAMVPLVAPSPARAAPTELFFSEYIEGSSNNKALEVYNGTGAAVDLDAGDYKILQYSNGGSAPGLTIELSGTVADGDVHVVAHSSASSPILTQADQTTGAGLFNGNDALELVKGSTVIDVIGQVGNDPGGEWGSGDTSTANNTLRRKVSVEAGDPIGSDAFDPAIEWDGFPENTFDGLGSHNVAAAAPVWVNEIHYDNAGADADEGIEVAGVAGTDLSTWSLFLYNGNGGTVYDTEVLSGTIPDQQNGFGTLNFPIAGIQNGSPDGIALVNGGSVVQFLSYEGTFTAVGGPADGLLSEDIGVAEGGSETVGFSLQLTGNGTGYDDFGWAEPMAHTRGLVNTGQSFGTITNQPVTVDCGSELFVVEGSEATRTITATDADGTVTSIGVSSITPTNPGTIGVGATTPAAEPGGTASAVLTVGSGTPTGTYTVNLTASNDEAEPQTGSCALSVRVDSVRTIGEIQGQTLDSEDGRSDVSPLDGETVFVRGVVTERIRQATSSGGTNYSFFLQDSADAADGDPSTSDGIVVFIGASPFVSNIGDGDRYFAEVGDQVILQARVDEFFNLTELVSPRFVAEEVDGGDLSTMIESIEADPPDDLDDAYRYWERHEGMYLNVPAGAVVTGARDVFASTHDGEVWVIRGDHPLAQRTDPYARRVFRDVHPLDDAGPLGSFDNGNGMRILLVSHGLKWNESSNETLIAPARVFDTVDNELAGGVFFTFGKYGIEVVDDLETTPAADPADNAPPVAHDDTAEYATAPYNVENLYDFRDDPFDGCDFEGNDGCPGVDPPFDYVPASEADYQAHLGALADQILNDLHAPDILLIQEAEDQDICAVANSGLVCGATDDRDGRPDTLQELGLAIQALGGPFYDAAYDRDGADDRGIVSGFLYRTDRVELLPADADHPVLGSAPAITYDGAGLEYNADVQNPKALNAELPEGVEVGDSCDVPVVDCVFTRDAQVGHFRVWRDGIGTSVFTDLYAVSNHFSSGPDSRVEQRTEQAAYNAAIVEALEGTEDGSRVVVGGDFNVFPEPDDPFPPPNESNQLAALYALGLHSLWEAVLAEAPSSAYSYVFEGQAQTLDNQFVTDLLDDELNGVRYAHVNADWPAFFEGDGSRGASDHDPQVARFDTLPTIDRLRDLVDYFVGEGLADAGKAALLHERLDRAERFYSNGQTDAGDSQLVAFGDQAQDMSPQWFDPTAADALQAEALLLIETR